MRPLHTSEKPKWDVGLVILQVVVIAFLAIMAYGAYAGFLDLQKRNTPLETAITRCLQYESPMVVVDRAIYLCDELLEAQ